MKGSGGGGNTIALGDFDLRPLPLIGAAALVVAAFLPWLSIGGGIGQGPAVTTNSFDISLSFLWDYTAAGSPYLGYAVLALAAAALFSGYRRSFDGSQDQIVWVPSQHNDDDWTFLGVDFTGQTLAMSVATVVFSTLNFWVLLRLPPRPALAAAP